MLPHRRHAAARRRRNRLERLAGPAVAPATGAGLFSLAAEFVGTDACLWPTAVQPLACAGQITPEAADTAELLRSFGALSGNTDMHHGNLSFIVDLRRRATALARACGTGWGE